MSFKQQKHEYFGGEPGVNQPSWYDEGVCRTEEIDNNIFFPVAEVDQAAAKAYCKRCFVVDQCLEYALETNQPDGVWGAKGPQERRVIRANRRNMTRKKKKELEAALAKKG